jgi:hypothetical protein
MDHRSELKLENADDLKIESRSSRITLGKVNKLTLKSYRDKYFADNISLLTANNEYTYLEIDTISQYLSATTKYGTIDISAIGSEVTRMDFTMENTDLGIKKPKTRAIALEAVYGESAGLFFSEELINKTTDVEDREKKLVRTRGIMGNDNGSPIKLNITMHTGNLNIKE